MRCDGCKYWDKDEGEHGTGLCTKAQPFWDASEWREYEDDDFPEGDEMERRWQRGLKPEFADLKMFCQDGSDYKAVLLTKPDFFCAHHEQKPA